LKATKIVEAGVIAVAIQIIAIKKAAPKNSLKTLNA
jgi:hypothetical protein